VRFLIDESLPRTVSRVLTDAGHDVLDVRDIGLRGAPDAAIAEHALRDTRIVVSADLDFSNALRFPPGTHPGIVVARLPAVMAPDAVAAKLAEAISDAGTALDGAITIVEQARVRIFR